MHLGNIRQRNAGIIHRWINYKSDWMQSVYSLAAKLNSTLLLFKTTNFICDKIRTNEWKEYSSLYTSFDNKTIENCYKMNNQFIGDDTYNLTSGQIQAYCKYGQFTEIGVQYLNDQVNAFVREIHNSQDSNSELTVGIYNDHDVEGCYSTKDAAHHILNMPIRVRLLANTIESYTECNRVKAKKNLSNNSEENSHG